MQTVLILGAASDIAMAVATGFAESGYDVQLAARNVDRLQPLVTDIAIRYGQKCTLHEFDATAYQEHEFFFDSLPVKPTVTVCVFGYMTDNEKARLSWTETETMIAVNFTGAVSILNVVSNYYEAQKYGTIVGISSVAGERGRQSNYIYGSAKAGFTTYLSGLRNRMKHENVQVITVKPGFVYTKMTADRSLPGSLTARPEEVAEAIYKAVAGKKNVIYVRWFWRWIMMIIKLIPEFIFVKLKL